MNLKEQIANDIKEAMKAKDSYKRDKLKFLISKIELAEQTKKGKRILSGQDIVGVIKTYCKELNTTIETKQSNDLNPSEELDELRIIEVYLPKQLTDEEIDKAIDETISEVGATSMGEFGKVMGLFSKRYSSVVDGNVSSKKIREKLS